MYTTLLNITIFLFKLLCLLIPTSLSKGIYFLKGTKHSSVLGCPHQHLQVPPFPRTHAMTYYRERTESRTTNGQSQPPRPSVHVSPLLSRASLLSKELGLLSPEEAQKMRDPGFYEGWQRRHLWPGSPDPRRKAGVVGPPCAPVTFLLQATLPSGPLWVHHNPEQAALQVGG